MGTVLKRQIDAFGRLLTDFASCPEELADLIHIGLGLVDSVAASIRRWQELIGRGLTQYNRAEAQAFMDHYHELHRSLWALEDAVASAGANIEEVAKLHSVRAQLGAMTKISVDRMERGIEQVKRGDGRPLEEVRDELRRRLGA